MEVFGEAQAVAAVLERPDGFLERLLVVLPMLMTSPTARIWVPSLSSEPLNFSNAQRENLTTT